VIAISEDREPANVGAHAQEALARLIPATPAGALPQVWCCARTLGEKDAARGYYCPESNAGPAFLSTPVQNDPAPVGSSHGPQINENIFRMVNPQTAGES
jgi:hypothetical protein